MSEPLNQVPPETPEPVQAPAQPQISTSPSGFAIASFVLGIISFATCGPCAGIPALVIGLIELGKIRNLTSSAEGKPFALTGAILGAINSAFFLLIIFVYLAFILIAILTGGFGH